MAVYTLLRGNWSSEAQGRQDLESLAEFRDYLASLPADRFPNALVVGPGLFRWDPNDFFSFGLEPVIAGLERALGDG